jgi:hypothetical protein
MEAGGWGHAGQPVPGDRRACAWRIRAIRTESGPPSDDGYNRGVSPHYSPDDANALVPDLAAVTARLRDERAELVGLRDAYRDRESAMVEALMADEPVLDDDDPELRRLRLRMLGLVDQMQADVAWLDARGIVLRDIPSGLVDVPAVVGGREAWLCWRLGEPAVTFAHRRDEGFDRRRPIAEFLAEPATSD